MNVPIAAATRFATSALAIAVLVTGCGGSEIHARRQPSAQHADAASDVRADAMEDASIVDPFVSSAPPSSSPRACIEDNAREAVRCMPDGTITPATRDAYEQLASRMWGAEVDRTRRADSRTRFEPRVVAGALAYLCAVGASSRRTPSADAGGADLSWLEATYRRGSIYRAAEQFDRAAVVFREVAFSDPAIPDPEGLRNFASDLYLDSLNQLANAPGRDRESCVAIMTTDLPPLRTMRCRVRNDDCERLVGIGCLIQRHQAERMTEAGRHADAARAYLALANDHDAQTADHLCRLDEALYNAAHEFDAGEMHSEARQARETLVRTYARRGSPLVQRAQEELRGSASAH